MYNKDMFVKIGQDGRLEQVTMNEDSHLEADYEDKSDYNLEYDNFYEGDAFYANRDEWDDDDEMGNEDEQPDCPCGCGDCSNCHGCDESDIRCPIGRCMGIMDENAIGVATLGETS